MKKKKKKSQLEKVSTKYHTLQSQFKARILKSLIVLSRAQMYFLVCLLHGSRNRTFLEPSAFCDVFFQDKHTGWLLIPNSFIAFIKLVKKSFQLIVNLKETKIPYCFGKYRLPIKELHQNLNLFKYLLHQTQFVFQHKSGKSAKMNS